MTDVKRDPSVEAEKREYTHAEQSSQSDDFDRMCFVQRWMAILKISLNSQK
jgi:hypothetical protein